MKNPIHEYRKKVKVFTGFDIGEIENKINDFIADEEMISVNVTATDFDQSGMMLCDRYNPNSDHTPLYTATVVFESDYTAEQIEKGKLEFFEKYVQEKVYPHIEKMKFPFFDMATGNTITKTEYIKNVIEKIKQSQEYKELYSKLEESLEEKYCIRWE